MKKIFSDKEMKIFERLVRMKEDILLKNLETFLKKYYKKIYSTKDYIYVKGDIPVVLLAHVDTVFSDPPRDIYCDSQKGVIWSPQGLGADDRAGVFGIMKIILDGYRPSIIFTTGEEMGGIGARAFVNTFSSPPKDIKYLIQLDRRGSQDCVFYNCNNQLFTEYVESFGFVEEYGTFTDISTICPRWKIAGVNLSIGYENEHSPIETFHMNYFLTTINRVELMLDDINNIKIPFEYVYDSSLFSASSWWAHSEWMMCDSCKDGFLEHEIFPAKDKDGRIWFYCPDCMVEKAGWCKVCGDAFVIDGKNKDICTRCAKETEKCATKLS